MDTPVIAMMHRSLSGLLLILALGATACGNASQKPLDGKSRQALDSITAEGIRLARIEVDSLCQQQRETLLPQLIDSIKQVRLREIEEKMKSVPK